MTRTDDRRLDKIEQALSPREAFLLWMAEAHEHESFAAYVMSLKGKPSAMHPIQRLPKQVEQGVRDAQKGQKADRVEQLVNQSVREVCFYYELHEAVTGRFALEWRALSFQLMLALEQAMRLTEKEEPSQQQLDQTRQWVVNGFCELLMWQRAAKQLSERYTGGVSLLFPQQEEGLRESIKSADWLVALFNDHIDWLKYLQEPARTKKPGRAKKTTQTLLSLEPLDLEALTAGAEREAAVMALQMVNLAKGEAAIYVHEPQLAAEFMDRVWLGLTS